MDNGYTILEQIKLRLKQFHVEENGAVVFTNKEVVLELLDMWKQYHLKTITNEQVNRLNELLDKLDLLFNLVDTLAV